MSPIPKYNRKRFLSFCWVVPFLSSWIPVKAFAKQSNGNKISRRVVTGINAEGKSIILKDGAVPKSAIRSTEPGTLHWNALWVEQQVPVDLSKNTETLEGYTLTLEPPQGGIIAHFFTLETGYEPDFHRTNTLDFIFIISGKLELLMEGNSTILSPGDTVVQRGTNHAWRVIGNEPCRVAAVVISATKS